MKKSEIDQIVSTNFAHIESRAQMFIQKSKLPVELDVVSWAYQQVIKKPEKLKTKNDVVSRMIQHCKMATIWSNSAYHSKFSKKEVKIDEEYIAILAPLVEIEHKQDSLIDEYLNQCSINDKLLLNLILSGFDSCSKLSQATTIPRSTCGKMMKELKERIKLFVDKTKNTHNISNQ